MKVLYVTNCYPVDEQPYYGIFVKEQIDAIRHYSDIEYDIFFINGLKGKLEYIKSISRIRKLIKTKEYDIVHVHYGISGLFLLLGKVNVPVILTLHGGDILTAQGKGFQVKISKMILKKVSAVIILNDIMRKAVEGFNDNIYHLPCSVNTFLFTPTVERPSKYSKDVKILFPSYRNRTVKNFGLFQSVCELLEKKYGYCVEQLYLEDKERHEVAELYNSIDLLLLTSISEGSPGVIKEGMACNVPIVSTNVGDVKNNLNGVCNTAVSESGDAEDLARLCNMCLNNSISGVSGRQKIKELGLDDKTVVDNLISIYKTLINSKKNG